MPRARRDWGEDDGFTLMELLLSMIILGIILAPLVTAFTLGLGTAARGQQDLTNSTDLQALSAYFTNDVQNADVVNTGSTSCGGAGTVAELRWVDGASTHAVAYVASEDATAEADLHRSPVYRIDRVQCDDGSVTGTIVVARSVATIPVATCDVSACPASSTPQRVAIQIDEFGAAASDPMYSFTASATRRVTTP